MPMGFRTFRRPSMEHERGSLWMMVLRDERLSGWAASVASSNSVWVTAASSLTEWRAPQQTWASRWLPDTVTKAEAAGIPAAKRASSTDSRMLSRASPTSTTTPLRMPAAGAMPAPSTSAPP